MATLFFDDWTPGRRFVPPPLVIAEGDVAAFAELTGDRNPLHTDPEFAWRGPFGRTIAHGFLNASVALGLLARTGVLDGSVAAFLEQQATFKGPVFPGDEVRLVAEVAEARPTRKGDRGVVTLRGVLSGPRGPAVEVRWVLLMARRPA